MEPAKARRGGSTLPRNGARWRRRGGSGSRTLPPSLRAKWTGFYSPGRVHCTCTCNKRTTRCTAKLRSPNTSAWLHSSDDQPAWSRAAAAKSTKRLTTCGVSLATQSCSQRFRCGSGAHRRNSHDHLPSDHQRSHVGGRHGRRHHLAPERRGGGRLGGHHERRRTESRRILRNGRRRHHERLRSENEGQHVEGNPMEITRSLRRVERSKDVVRRGVQLRKAHFETES
jgi:hypothetical protein